VRGMHIGRWLGLVGADSHPPEATHPLGTGSAITGTARFFQTFAAARAAEVVIASQEVGFHALSPTAASSGRGGWA